MYCTTQGCTNLASQPPCKNGRSLTPTQTPYPLHPSTIKNPAFDLLSSLPSSWLIPPTSPLRPCSFNIISSSNNHVGPKYPHYYLRETPCGALYYYQDFGLIKRCARPDSTAVNRGSRNPHHCTIMRLLEANVTSLSLNYRSNDLCICNLCLLHSDMSVIDQDVQGIFSYT